MVYYNDNDQFCCAWLRNLIEAGHLPKGTVDERSIAAVRPDDLARYQQAHFFSGIGGWPLALELAGWPNKWHTFTGSAPCQPFSAAGKRKALHDERDLWPAFFRLIAECRPDWVFGEQVEAAIGWGWLDRICDDLGGEGYTVRAAVLPACSVGAPHIRQRLYWVAHHDQAGLSRLEDARLQRSQIHDIDGRSKTNGLAIAPSARHTRTGQHHGGSSSLPARLEQCSKDGRLGTTDCAGLQGCNDFGYGRPLRTVDAAKSPWGASRIIECLDGKQRRVPLEPALFPLVDDRQSRNGNGMVGGRPANRAQILKGAGNAIVPALAAQFIRAAMDIINK